MPARWTISSFPRCRFHVFLSHCAEDRHWLVAPLFERLKEHRIIPWIDRHHYPSGTDPYEALREGILPCRHIVYLITLAMLDQARGWVVLEKAYAGLLQENMRDEGRELGHIELPLLLVPRDHAVFVRSVWHPIAARGKFHTPGDGVVADWAAREIVRFVYAEEKRAVELGESIEHDPRDRARIARRPGLLDRIQANYPALDPVPSPSTGSSG